MKSALEIIADHAHDGAMLREKFFQDQAENIRKAAFAAALSLARNGKILFCGNGGSAADAQHLAGEFVNRFLINRPALPGLALTTDTSVITAIANDFNFNQIFSRQVEAFGAPGDMLLAISTSGNSANVIEALQTARQRGLQTVGLTGAGGGAMAQLCDLLIDVPSTFTPLIQEVHLACEHLFCQLTDYYLFENVKELSTALNKEN